MTLPYRWHPRGADYVRRPEPGQFLPFEHAVYRVLDVRVNDDGRIVVHVRPADSTSVMTAADEDLHLGASATFGTWQVYRDGHYPICASCREPLPCREQMAEQISKAASRRMGRYEVAGVCPACEQPVSARQKSWTWPENVEIPGGPPVTFHQRRRCAREAVQYEKRWVAADPDRRRALLSCPGHFTRHGDGTYECTQLVECPGPRAAHPSYRICRGAGCTDTACRGLQSCTPDGTETRRTTDA